jgi:mannose-6-phosphate isomerase-like protein (cupin superfamily)
MLSKTSIVSLEHGRCCQPATLAKVCAAMNLHLERLVEPADGVGEGGFAVQRLDDYRWYDLSSLAGGELAPDPLTLEDRNALRMQGPDALMTMFRNVPSATGVLAGIIEMSQETENRSHPGAEFAYVLSGCARIVVDGREVVLEPGESIFIESMAPHSYGAASRSKVPVALLLIRFG